MSQVILSDTVRAKLAEALLEDQDLLGSLGREQPQEDSEQPGLYRCHCTLAVRRPLDPETSELRQLEVLLRRTETGFEAYELRGLEDFSDQLE